MIWLYTMVIWNVDIAQHKPQKELVSVIKLVRLTFLNLSQLNNKHFIQHLDNFTWLKHDSK